MRNQCLRIGGRNHKLMKPTLPPAVIAICLVIGQARQAGCLGGCLSRLDDLVLVTTPIFRLFYLGYRRVC